MLTANSTTINETTLAAKLEIPAAVILHWIRRGYLAAEKDEIGYLIENDDLEYFMERFNGNVELCQTHTRQAAEMRMARETFEELDGA